MAQLNHLTLVNHLPPAMRAIDQFAIQTPELVTLGGFTLAIADDTILLLGFHSEQTGSLLWVFKELRKRYPNHTTMIGYRATGVHSGQLLRWQASGERWILER